jgi:DNA-binding transcriptional ArsR family regulator
MREVEHGRAEPVFARAEEHWEEAPDEVIEALGHPMRLRIFRILNRGPRRVTRLAEAVERKIQTLKHHLEILRRAGLVEVVDTEDGGRLVRRIVDTRFMIRRRRL